MSCIFANLSMVSDLFLGVLFTVVVCRAYHGVEVIICKENFNCLFVFSLSIDYVFFKIFFSSLLELI
jgi:hypothetical protein